MHVTLGVEYYYYYFPSLYPPSIQRAFRVECRQKGRLCLTSCRVKYQLVDALEMRMEFPERFLGEGSWPGDVNTRAGVFLLCKSGSVTGAMCKEGSGNA